jgi:hypothetical protein
LFFLLLVAIFVWYLSIQSNETFDSDITCKWDCNCYNIYLLIFFWKVRCERCSFITRNA